MNGSAGVVPATSAQLRLLVHTKKFLNGDFEGFGQSQNFTPAFEFSRPLPMGNVALRNSRQFCQFVLR